MSVETMLILTVKGVIMTERAEEIFSTIRSMFNVVKELEKKYDNGGISYVGLIEESTMAMHYYPEYGLMTVIVSTCGDREETISRFRHVITDLVYSYGISYKIMEIDVSGKMHPVAEYVRMERILK